MRDTAPLAIDTFLHYMRDVVRCEQTPRELDPMWRMIDASANMHCPPLYEIMSAAETMRRVVRNGQMMTAGQRSELCSQSIRDLYERGAPEFCASQLVPTPLAARAEGLQVKQVIEALDVGQLFARLKAPSLPAVLNLTDAYPGTGRDAHGSFMREAA